MTYSTKYPKTLNTMEYTDGGTQSWQQMDLGYDSAYPTITGRIFEFGFTDSILQMWAAFCDELVNESGRNATAVLLCDTRGSPAKPYDLHPSVGVTGRRR